MGLYQAEPVQGRKAKRAKRAKRIGGRRLFEKGWDLGVEMELVAVTVLVGRRD